MKNKTYTIAQIIEIKDILLNNYSSWMREEYFNSISNFSETLINELKINKYNI